MRQYFDSLNGGQVADLPSDRGCGNNLMYVKSAVMDMTDKAELFSVTCFAGDSRELQSQSQTPCLQSFVKLDTCSLRVCPQASRI